MHHVADQPYERNLRPIPGSATYRHYAWNEYGQLQDLFLYRPRLRKGQYVHHA